MDQIGTAASLALFLVVAFFGNSLSSGKTPSVREQLASLQAETGLTLTGYSAGDLESIGFAHRTVTSEDLLVGSRGYPGVGTLSPDGAELAFKWVSPSNTRILAIMHRDGSGLREFPTVREPGAFCWSPDKTRLVMSADIQKEGENERGGLVLLHLASGVVEQIGPEGFVTPQCWSPDGKQITYTVIDFQYQSIVGYRVGVFDIAQRNWRELAHGKDASWSPDGAWIAFLEKDGYYAVRPSGADRKLLLNVKDPSCCLAWSPHSSFVAYAVTRLSFMNPSRVLTIRVRRLVDGSDDWVAKDIMLGTHFSWIQAMKRQLSD